MMQGQAPLLDSARRRPLSRRTMLHVGELAQGSLPLANLPRKRAATTGPTHFPTCWPAAKCPWYRSRGGSEGAAAAGGANSDHEIAANRQEI